MGASPKAMYPFIAIRGVLAQRMVTMEYTILLLQQMGIIATSGTCRQCQGDLEEQYKSSTNNKRYWWCSLRKLELYLNLFLWFHDQKLTGKDVFWSLCSLISKNNTREAWDMAQGILPDIEAVGEAEEAVCDQNENEEEYESSGGETDDDEEEMVFSCPWCHRMFDTKAEVVEHVSGCANK